MLLGVFQSINVIFVGISVQHQLFHVNANWLPLLITTEASRNHDIHATKGYKMLANCSLYGGCCGVSIRIPEAGVVDIVSARRHGHACEAMFSHVRPVCPALLHSTRATKLHANY